MCLGVGDTAASLVGILYGRLRLARDTSKTLEGTAAGAAAMLACWLAAALWLAPRGCARGAGALEASAAGAKVAGVHQAFCAIAMAGGAARLLAVTCGAALLEASTHQIDNLVVPVYFAAALLLFAG